MPRGIPNELQLRDNRTKDIPSALLPLPSDAVASYESSGGHITAPKAYGMDPLSDDQQKKAMREEAFERKFSLESIFDSVVNDNGESFETALLFFTDVTHRLSLSK
ncbi:MAG: hypothetical protein MPL62_13000 [Alphaproteobacteria bacterium]|nr:hypothetical protein [Alphaproteobacteria bacterium]